MGFDTVWLAEHHFSPERAVLASPMVIASAIAARTERIRTGLAVQVLPLTNPLRVAEEAATVDHISKGRFDFGIGRSGLTKYYQGLQRALRREPLPVPGGAGNHNEGVARGQPDPRGRVPHLPRRDRDAQALPAALPAGARGRGRGGHLPAGGRDGTSHLHQRQHGARGAEGTPGRLPREAGGIGASGTPDIAIRVPVYCAETTEKAHEEPRESALGAIQYAVTELIQTAANPEIAERMRRIAAAPYEQVLEERVLFGTPAEIVDKFKGYQEELGVTGVVMEVNYGGQIPQDRVNNSLRLISNEVMPEFKG